MGYVTVSVTGECGRKGKLLLFKMLYTRTPTDM